MQIAFDFGICINEAGEYEPQLIEMQGFPTLFAYEVLLDDISRKYFPVPENFSCYLNGFNRDSYINLLKDKDLKKLLGRYYTVSSIEKENDDQRIRYSAELADSRFKHINPLMLRENLKRALNYEKETAIYLY